MKPLHILTLLVSVAGAGGAGNALSNETLSTAILAAPPASIAVNQYIGPDDQLARRQFEDLSKAAFFYLELAGDERWKPLQRGPLLRLGDRHPQVIELRQMLFLYGDLPFSTDQLPASDLFDQPLQQALISFQQRHGAKADGILGPKTREVLNVSPRQRALQIALNLQRQQQFSGRDQQRYVQVNIPEYRLRYVEEGNEVLAMKTIIGRRSRQTPMLESKIRTLVLNPSWSVPKGIAFKDILPGWKQDSEYLNKHNLRVIAGWTQPRQELAADQVDHDKFYRGKEYLRFWQPPGDDNALGRVKFLFPNPHSVYLHDTPGRSLFDSASRAFSSGCIRLEKPLLLARTLLSRSGRDKAVAIESILDRRKTKAIRLEQPVPLYLTYWTAWLDDDQVLNFGEDVYRQDRAEFSQQLL